MSTFERKKREREKEQVDKVEKEKMETFRRKYKRNTSRKRMDEDISNQQGGSHKTYGLSPLTPFDSP